MECPPKIHQNIAQSNQKIIQRRQQLVRLVVDQGLAVAKISKILRLNISTAKLIIRKYLETGSFFCKRMCKASNFSTKIVKSKNTEELRQ